MRMSRPDTRRSWNGGTGPRRKLPAGGEVWQMLYLPFFRYFRARRMSRFAREFQIDPETRVLDVGGLPAIWSFLPGSQRPRLIMVNLAAPRRPSLPWVVADGARLPFRENEFDVVYSNSVIEHLGDAATQKRFAEECSRVGVRYYIQTPNRRFPIEPHLLTPFVHWLPRGVRRRLLRNFTLWGLLNRPDPERCDALLAEIRLLDEAEMRVLFPDATIWRERFLGLVKSLVAVRNQAR